MIAIINEPVKEKVKRYTIMHEDAPVLEFNRETDEIYNVLAKDSKNANIIGACKECLYLIILLQTLICTMIIMGYFMTVKRLSLKP